MNKILTDDEIYLATVQFANKKGLLRCEFDDETIIEFLREYEQAVLNKLNEQEPSVPTKVTCQIYGHVVGACDECNTHAENDVNETNKILADNYLKLTCGSSPSVLDVESQAAEIEKYKALYDQMGNALSSLNRFASQQICEHTETYRGGTIWEICRQCGAKWADDEGGKPNFVEPVVITNAIAALEAWRAMK